MGRLLMLPSLSVLAVVTGVHSIPVSSFDSMSNIVQEMTIVIDENDKDDAIFDHSSSLSPLYSRVTTSNALPFLSCDAHVEFERKANKSTIALVFRSIGGCELNSRIDKEIDNIGNTDSVSVARVI